MKKATVLIISLSYDEVVNGLLTFRKVRCLSRMRA